MEEPKRNPHAGILQWGDLFCSHCQREMTEQEIQEGEGDGCPLDEGGFGMNICGKCCKSKHVRYFYHNEIWFADLCKKCDVKKRIPSI